MWDRIKVVHSQAKRQVAEAISKPGRRPGRQPRLELLENRQLLTASLSPITSMNVTTQEGAVVALLAQSVTGNHPQTFTVTSSQPNILASIVQGPFWNMGVSYTDPANSLNSFTGTLTFQLFSQLTPNTVNMITTFSNENYFATTGKFFPRIVTNFGQTGNDILQGGSNNSIQGTPSGLPGTPFPNENLQQLVMTGTNQIAMANTGAPDSNDTQFFITTGNIQSALTPYGFTIFGQMVSGQTTLTQMANIPVGTNPKSGEDSLPNNPLTITSTTFTTTNPNGVLLIDTSHTMTAGEQATITVTATDDVDHTTATQSFTVTTTAFTTPTDPPINFAPFANPTNVDAPSGTSTQLQLNGKSGYPDTTTPATLTYSQLSQPTHGTVTDFNASTGTFVYTPDKDYLGPDTFNYQVSSTGPQATPAVLDQPSGNSLDHGRAGRHGRGPGSRPGARHHAAAACRSGNEQD